MPKTETDFSTGNCKDAHDERGKAINAVKGRFEPLFPIKRKKEEPKESETALRFSFGARPTR